MGMFEDSLAKAHLNATQQRELARDSLMNAAGGIGSAGSWRTVDTSTGVNISDTALTTHLYPSHISSPGPGFETITSKELEHAAFNTPVQVLLDAWGQRYDNAWVPRDKVLQDAFFAVAFKRLRKLGKIEEHFLSDTMQHVCRRVPDEHL